MTFLPRTALAVAIAALSILVLGVTLGSFVVAVVIIAALLDAFSVRQPTTVTRSFPAILPRATSQPLSITATHPGSDHVEIRQPRPPDVAIETASGVGSIESTITALRRGRHAIPEVVTRTHGPLGLGAWLHTSSEHDAAVVYPDVIAARNIARAVARGTFQDAGSRATRRFGLGTEFETIRDYSSDDDIRQVNWKATMRMGKPMSNAYRIDQDRDVICLIDTGRLMGAPLGALTRLDAAIDAVAAIAYTADVLGDRVGAIAFHNAITTIIDARRRGGEAVVAGTYALEPVEIESNYEAAFRAVGRAKRSLVVVFTDLLDRQAAQTLVDAIPIIGRKHAVIVASATDRDISAALTTDPTTEFEAYRSAAALTAIEEKERITAQLVRRAAAVIEAPSDQLAATCVAAYLDAKALARI